VQFTSSRATKGDVEGVRIWRIEDRTGPMPEPRKRRSKAEMTETTMTASPAAPAEQTPPPPPPPAAG
jgi:hypothetical protein